MSCSDKKQLIPCPTQLFPTDCGHVPSFYANTSLQILCPNSSVFFSPNPSLPTQDTTISDLVPGSIEVLNSGYYDVQFLALVSGIGSHIAACFPSPNAQMPMMLGCGSPTFAICINGKRANGSVYSLPRDSGQLHGIGSYFFRRGDIVSVTNVSRCAVSLGSVGPTIFPTARNNVLGACGVGSSSATIQMTYRGKPLQEPSRCGCDTCTGSTTLPSNR